MSFVIFTCIMMIYGLKSENDRQEIEKLNEQERLDEQAMQMLLKKAALYKKRS